MTNTCTYLVFEQKAEEPEESTKMTWRQYESDQGFMITAYLPHVTNILKIIIDRLNSKACVIKIVLTS